MKNLLRKILPERVDSIANPVVRHPLVADADQWPDILKNDFIKFFAGKKIGEGSARWVYEMRYQPDLVIKVEFTESTFQNVQEWATWSEVQFEKFGGMLAPCRRISSCGHILIQEKTEKLKPGEVPSSTPSFIRDRKLKNYGRSKRGSIVCHDYAINNLHKTGLDNAEIEEIPKSFWVTS